MKKLLALIAIIFTSSFAYGQTDTVIKHNDTLITLSDTVRLPAAPDSIINLKDSINTPASKVVKGVASFYSKNLEGTKTATGEIFHHNKLTGASNNFKLNSWVRVTNLSNKKSIIVRVNDRMHKNMAKKGRVIDLTRLGAKKLDFLKKGLTKVMVEEVPKGTVD